MTPIRSELMNTKEIAERAVKRTLDFADARKGPSMKATLVLDRTYASRLIYYMISPLIDVRLTKRSF